MRKIGAVILAAGRAARFGQPKQLLVFHGKTLVRTVVDAAREAGCWPVVLVVGNNRKKIQRELAHANVITVQNAKWQRGIGSSVRIGVQTLSHHAPDVEATFLFVSDQPAVNARLIERMIAMHVTTKKDIVASSYADTVGVPALFDRSLFGDLLSLDDKSGAKSIILRNRERVVRFPFPEGAVDIDTLEDWEKFNKRG